MIKVAGRKTKTMLLKMLKCTIEVMRPIELDAIICGSISNTCYITCSISFFLLML